MIAYQERTLVCVIDDCGQESRPHHSRCWHHWMMTSGRASWLSLHSFLPEIIGDYEAMKEHPYSDESGPGCFYLRYIEDCREVCEGDQPDERPMYYDAEEALEHMPDLESASASGMMDEMIHVYSWRKLVACVYFEWCEFDEEDSDESDEVQP